MASIIKCKVIKDFHLDGKEYKAGQVADFTDGIVLFFDKALEPVTADSVVPSQGQDKVADAPAKKEDKEIPDYQPTPEDAQDQASK